MIREFDIFFTAQLLSVVATIMLVIPLLFFVLYSCCCWLIFFFESNTCLFDFILFFLLHTQIPILSLSFKYFLLSFFFFSFFDANFRILRIHRTWYWGVSSLFNILWYRHTKCPIIWNVCTRISAQSNFIEFGTKHFRRTKQFRVFGYENFNRSSGATQS